MKRKKRKHLTKGILDILEKNPKQSYTYKQIATRMGISGTDGRTQLLKKLVELAAKKKIREPHRGKYACSGETKTYHEGTLDATSGGNAYFVSEDFEEDIFVPSANLNRGLHGDTVKVYVRNRDGNKNREAFVVEVLKRKKTTFIGILQMEKNFGFVISNSPKMYTDIFISKGKINGAKNGDKVAVTITDWPEDSKNPFGKITRVLGKPGEHPTEIQAILLEHNVPPVFSEEIESYTKKIPTKITKAEIAKRRDMRKDLTFTIDPKDAKDFDDALSFTPLESGNYEIGIHIADVSHYVRPKTILEEEAYNRATSVYLVDRVIPMLPEVLSNGVCSLRAKEEKLTFSAVFTLNEKGEVIDQWFGRTVIYSKQRFSYEEAQSILENGKTSTKKTEPYTVPKAVSITNKAYRVDAPLVEALLQLNVLAKKLRKKRLQQGAITFNKVEVKFDLDEQANPIGVFFKESKDAHNLIEEFMLLANKKVAEFIGKKKGKPSKNTFIYRVHDKPNMEKIAALQNIVDKLGYTINIKNKDKTAQSLNKLLRDVHGKKEANMIETLAIRSMSKAVYTTQNIGHYGLAFDYYSHFTSPIRRYPDVMTHRLLQHYLEGGKSPNAASYEEKCLHASQMEELAVKAERDSVKYMQIKYMQNQPNKVFEGIISGVTEWGIYVEITENKCEGMVRVRDLKKDRYVFDEKQYAFIGPFGKHSYQLGDKVTVRVKNIDMEKKHLDFYLIDSKKKQ